MRPMRASRSVPLLRHLALAMLFIACGRSGARPSEPAPRSPSLTARGQVGSGAELAAWDSASCPSLAARRADTASSGRTPTIILCAGVGAREVHFNTQPDISVRLTGALGDSVRVLERRNLPRPVVAGTTYRDVFVAVEIVANLADSCREQAADTTRAGTTALCADILRADSARGRPR